MRRDLAIAFVLVCASAFGQSPEMKVIMNAAEALGGKDRILSIKTLKIQGYGQMAYMNGGGNITASPDAPQKWWNVGGVERTIDFEHGRMRLKQRQLTDFVFANLPLVTTGIRINQTLDGDIAYNLGGGGFGPPIPENKATRAPEAAVRERRIEMLDNPVSIVRSALDATTKVSGLRNEAGRQVLDITTARGDKLTLAVDATTHLPVWLSWVGPDANLGDVRYRTYFTGYQAERGIMLPFGYNTKIDFRDIVQNKLYVDRNTIDGPIPDLVAPAEIRSTPAPGPRSINVEATPVAKGVWYLKGAGGSTVFEFADHLTMFEVNGNEQTAKANIDKARSLVPGKPLTEVIVSHHHFDHSGGLRTAVAEGLTIITHRGNVDLFKEMAARPAKEFPDALGRNPKLIRIVAVDEKLVLKDSTMEVVVYHAINNSHMANGVFAYVPRDKLVAEGDFVDEGWDLVYWGNTYPDSVKFYKLQVDKDLPVHGGIHTYAEVLEYLKKQTKNAQDLCDRVEQSGLSMQGCPVSNTF